MPPLVAAPGNTSSSLRVPAPESLRRLSSAVARLPRGFNTNRRRIDRHARPASQVVTMTMAATPAWTELKAAVDATPRGAELTSELALRAAGDGAPHTDCSLRLFGHKEQDVRLVLYRDMAAWCPYCQKVWLMLEEKKVPYRIEKINMRSYGDKPQWFLEKISSGLLPVIELDGKMITESLVIMQIIEREFPAPEYPSLIPGPGSEGFDRANGLLKLERNLFSEWCGLIFRPSGPSLFGGGAARKNLEATLDKVNKELGVAAGPWFLGGELPSIVDMQYVSHVERMVASCLYWKGMQIRGEGAQRWPNIERWLDAFEQRPSYQATMSDFYTHVRDIPPQYGPGYPEDDEATKRAEEYISGKGDAWRLPLDLGVHSLQPLSPHLDRGEAAARQEAAWKLVGNHAAVARFAARGDGKRGKKQFQAPLADPYAEPNEALVPLVEETLRAVAAALLADATEAEAAAAAAAAAVPEAQHAGVAKSLAYLRDRVGVPRDMSYPAAMYFRAYLNLFRDHMV